MMKNYQNWIISCSVFLAALSANAGCYPDPGVLENKLDNVHPAYQVDCLRDQNTGTPAQETAWATRVCDSPNWGLVSPPSPQSKAIFQETSTWPASKLLHKQAETIDSYNCEVHVSAIQLDCDDPSSVTGCGNGNQLAGTPTADLGPALPTSGDNKTKRAPAGVGK